LILDALTELLKDETAGDPVSGVKWTRKTVRRLTKELKRTFNVSRETVRRLAISLGYRLRSNRKRLTRKQDPKRDRQMRYIIRRRRAAIRAGKPVISVDTKHRELVGLFKNAGRTWRRTPVDVMDSDYPSDAMGVAIPYGIYDITNNRGYVVVGSSCQTPEFAVNSIRAWWVNEGKHRFPDVESLLIEADGGNPNSYRSSRFKYALQKFADVHRLVVMVCHYPTGASKWNPIEHRLFSQISSNWHGTPLTSFEVVMSFIRTTRTDNGLRCRAERDERIYKTKIPITKEQKDSVKLHPHRIHPEWNYTIRPVDIH
jgi:Rhodopirellula transposase DDE domain